MMKKKDFVTMILSAAGGLPFAIGMCMCLLPAWNTFRQGVVMAVVGIVILLVMLLVRRKMEGKPAIVLNAKAIGTALFGFIGALALGVGMRLTMVWERLTMGIVVGVVGIALLICLVPLVNGLEE